MPENCLLSLDVFRGLIIAAMILVTDPGTYDAVYPPLLHAAWVGATPTDIIFPSFLVMVGMAMTLSFAARLERGATRAQLLFHTLRRSALLVLVGLFLNAFPDFAFHTLRLPGILQRIALCYLAAALLYLVAGRARRPTFLAAAFVGLLAVYWALLKLYPVPGFGPGGLDSYTNVGAYVDRRVFSVAHLWPYGTTPGHGVTFDPEGIVSTLGALATTLLGVLAGDWLRTPHTRERKAAELGGVSLLLVCAGLALSPWMPLIKKIWTPTFALVSGGVALLLFAVLYYVLDIRRWRAGTAVFRIFGTNAIFAFALSTVITTLAARRYLHVASAGNTSLHLWAYRHVFAPVMPSQLASLAYAVTIVLFNLALVYPLYRRRIFLRL